MGRSDLADQGQNTLSLGNWRAIVENNMLSTPKISLYNEVRPWRIPVGGKKNEKVLVPCEDKFLLDSEEKLASRFIHSMICSPRWCQLSASLFKRRIGRPETSFNTRFLLRLINKKNSLTPKTRDSSESLIVHSAELNILSLGFSINCVSCDKKYLDLTGAGIFMLWSGWIDGLPFNAWTQFVDNLCLEFLDDSIGRNSTLLPKSLSLITKLTS